ncbi:MAG: glycosyltransferase [Candidatus Aenigmarchaeota archaeon]|nr:glycosyltransferase [Candidatus Aenigmarchaeota archaeon]
MKYSFIIPTRNEAPYVKGCIDSIRAQSVSDWEIIVVDSYSSDGTESIAKEGGARVLYEKRKGPGVARNTGALRARGDMLIFADADVRFPQDFLEQLGDVKGGCIFNVRFWDAGALQSLIFSVWNVMIRIMMRMGIYVTNGSCMALNKSVFKEVRGFRPDLLTNEDHDLAIRAAKTASFAFVPLTVYTSARRLHRAGTVNYIMMHYRNTRNYALRGESNPDYWK